MPQSNTSEEQIKGTAAITNATVSYTGEKDVSRWIEAIILLNCNAGGGTTPTLTLTLQTKSDDQTKWYDHSTLVSALDVSGATTTALVKAYGITNFGSKIRVGYVLGGTSPTATIDISIIKKSG